jgi:sugar/nucleoside kinase (ribokinase family)
VVETLIDDRVAGTARRRVCVIGELLLEFLPASDSVVLSSHGQMVKSPSGAAGIFACAAAALGGNAGLIGRVGDDAFSRFVLDEVEAHGVDVSQVGVVGGRQIGLAFVEEVAGRRNFIYYRRDSAGSTLSGADIDPGYIRSSAAIHFPAMLLWLSQSMREACLQAIALAKAYGVLVSIDPNIRPELGDPGDNGLLRRVLSQADVLTPNIEEACRISGTDNPGAALSRLLAMGPSVVAITRGAGGALLGSATERVELPGIAVNAVDTVGAGDTFAAGLLVALLEGMEIREAGRFANSAAALKASRLGAIGRGLPERAEVLEQMAPLAARGRHVGPGV